MAVIEVLKRGLKFSAQFRTDNGRIDKIAGTFDSQQEAKRKLLAWKQQVNRASIKMMPITPLPDPIEDLEDIHPDTVFDEYEDENLHAQGNGDEGVDDEDDDDEDDGDSLYTVGELMEYLKVDLIEIGESWGVDTNGTKKDIAQRIVNAQNDDIEDR